MIKIYKQKVCLRCDTVMNVFNYECPCCKSPYLKYEEIDKDGNVLNDQNI